LKYFLGSRLYLLGATGCLLVHEVFILAEFIAIKEFIIFVAIEVADSLKIG
jgi:hypothetical protein